VNRYSLNAMKKIEACKASLAINDSRITFNGI
jgi:hypothetical protein